MNEKKKNLSIAIIENEDDFRQIITDQLKLHPNVRKIRSFHSCETWWHSKAKEKFDLLLLDITLPGMNGLELLKLIQLKKIPLKVIMLTKLDSEDTIVSAIKWGANGYIWKSEIHDICSAIDVVVGGGAMITPTIALKLMKTFQPSKDPAPESSLTIREKEILDIIVTGVSCEKCSDILNISIYTVRKHISNVYEKLQVQNRVELMKRATELGII